MEDTKKTKPRKKRKLYKRLSLLILVVFLAIAVFYTLNKLSQPATAKVTVTQGGLSPNTYNIDLTPTPATGTYASFDYPKGLRLVSKTLNGGSSVEDFNFYVKDVSSWTLAIDVSQTPTGTLSESSAYTLRKDNPQTYSENVLTVNDQQVNVMTDKTAVGSFSKVAFLTHGTLLATVSLLGDDSSGTQPLQTTFNMVLNSWHWQ